MKKALSVLLVVAALFGFYGSAVTVNDLLACKDYWEEAGEKSTADMNKLEDGLNQLKDNEQAYLDGQGQVADGEAQLAEGEEQLAAGEAELAAGEASYAAAPAKLASARNQIAAGESALSQGKKDLASLNTLIDGIEQVLENYPTFREGYTQLKDARKDTLSQKSMAATQQLLPKVLQLVDGAATDAGQKIMSAAGIMQQQAASIGYTNSDYDDFNTALTDLKDGLETAKKTLDGMESSISTALDAFTKSYTIQSVTLTPLAAADIVKTGSADPRYPVAYGILYGTDGTDGFIAQFAPNLSALGQAVGGLDDAELSDYQSAASAFDVDHPDNIKNVYNILKNTDDAAVSYQTLLGNKISDASLWTGGYQLLNEKRVDTKEGLPYLAGGVAQIIGGVLDSGNKELINGMNKAASAFGFKAADFTPVAKSKLTKDLRSNQWMEDFLADGNKIEKAFTAVLPSLKDKADSGQEELDAGTAKLNKGKNDYAEGLAAYKAAPAQLAEGRAKLAEGLQQLMDGRKALEDGKAQLAQYEDGEQQIRDGLATLFNTEADLDLVSIADRLNGDGDFDNGDKHLEIEEGLNAVDVGRGYQAEDGVLITDEIMGRAVATGGLIAAAVLAVIAAILSFLKKNKGAAVFAILAAAAGAFGAFYGPAQGTYFSDIAGSTVGTTTWVAAGVLGAVALVHAIVHFAAPKTVA